MKGKAGEEMKHKKHSLPVGGQSVIGQATATGQPIVLNDVTLEESTIIHRPNPLLPNTRAELGIPLKIGDRIIGALDVQSNKANVFNEDNIAVLQILADQIAVGVDNAHAYEMSLKAVEEIRNVPIAGRGTQRPPNTEPRTAAQNAINLLLLVPRICPLPDIAA